MSYCLHVYKAVCEPSVPMRLWEQTVYNETNCARLNAAILPPYKEETRKCACIQYNSCEVTYKHRNSYGLMKARI